MKQILQLLFLLIIIAACDDAFDAPSKAFLNATIRYTEDKIEETGLAIAVSAKGVDNDSIWIYQDTTRSILLPMKSIDTTAYVFALNGLLDTVTFIAESETVYESMETGFYTEYKLNDLIYTGHRIDKIEIVDSLVTKEWNENIIIHINNLIDATN